MVLINFVHLKNNHKIITMTTKAEFMGVPISKLEPYIDKHKKLIENLDEASFNEKMDSIRTHLNVLETFKKEKSPAFEDCLIGMLTIIYSL